jgi:hypothetical protein
VKKLFIVLRRKIIHTNITVNCTESIDISQLYILGKETVRANASRKDQE